MKGSLIHGSVSVWWECHCFEEMLSFRKAKHRLVLFEWQIKQTQLQCQSESSNWVLGAIFWYKSCTKCKQHISNITNFRLLSAFTRKGLRNTLDMIYMNDNLDTSQDKCQPLCSYFCLINQGNKCLTYTETLWKTLWQELITYLNMQIIWEVTTSAHMHRKE